MSKEKLTVHDWMHNSPARSRKWAKSTRTTERGKVTFVASGLLAAMVATGATAEWAGNANDEPTRVQVLQNQFKQMRKDPSTVDPDHWVTYKVKKSDEELGIYGLARKLAGEGHDDSELENQLMAQADEHGNLHPGDVFIDPKLVQVNDGDFQLHTVSTVREN